MFQILHSSAGAGKTHSLVKHYLAHCLSGDDPGAYRQVLALTFTNKAAGEMKARVMGYLRKLASGDVNDDAMRDVLEHLERRSGKGRAVIEQRADAVLRHMLHHWSDVAISTIDAFTRRVVRPFARDLQLDHDLQMTTDQDHYLNAAVDGLIGEAGTDLRITGILTEACLQLLHEEQKWDPELPLRTLAHELQKESAIGPLSRLGAMDALVVTALSERLRSEERAFGNSLRKLGREALKHIEAAHIAPEHLAYGYKGIYSTFRKLAAFEDAWQTPGQQARKPLESGTWHSAKADPSVRSALEHLAPRLQAIFEEAEQLTRSGHATFLMQRAVARDLPATFALHELERHLSRLKQEDGVAFFSDLTRKVAEVVQHEPVPFIHERMGERYRHYLIDEFQDTSLLQWTCLLPLIDNALSTGGSALLVGDAKQAIYRWRNGEVRLFVNLPKLFGRGDSELEQEREETLQRNYHTAEPLAFNRRSSPVIIQFNNDLFGALATELPEDLRSVYEGHAQQSGGSLPGLVHLQLMPRDVKGEDRWDLMLENVMDRLRESIADGAAPGDVAILVRTGSQGRRVAEHLVKAGFAVVSPDGLKISGDPVVELLIDLLRAVQRADETAAARVMQYRARLRALPDATEVLLADPGTKLPKPLRELLDELVRQDLIGVRTTFTELLQRLCHWLHIRPAEEAPVLALLDEAHSWSTAHGPDIDGFIDHWKRSGSNRSVAPPENGQAVQVMTIHKAKGLEFPVVIMPNASMTTRGDGQERLWVDPRPAVPDLDAALVRDSKMLQESGVTELQVEMGLRHLDALDLLYVAFTRPVHRLYAFIPEDAADIVSKGVMNYMNIHGSEGSLTIGERHPLTSAHHRQDAITLRDVSTPDAPLPMTMRWERPEDWVPGSSDPYRAHGRTVHAVLARIRTPHDLPDAISAAVRDGELPAEEASLLHDRLAQLRAGEQVGSWFAPGPDVRTEATIIDEQGTAWRPDRVILDHDLVRVLDIKTGQPREEHDEQVAGYMSLLKRMGHARVEGALLYVRTGELRPVNP